MPGHDLTTEAALTKLAYLLSFPTSTPTKVSRMMAIPLRGELTPSAQMTFAHPHSSNRPQRLATLGKAISKGDIDRVHTLLKHEDEWLLNEGDGDGDTPLVCCDKCSIKRTPRA